MIKKIFSYFSQGFIRRWIIASQPWGALQGQTFRRILPFKSWLWRWRLSRCCQVRHLLSHWIYIPLDNRLLRIFKCSIKECNQVLPGAEDNDRRECHIVPTWGLLFPKTNPLIWHRVRPDLTLMIAALIDPFRRSIVEIILSFRQASAQTPTTLTITRKKNINHHISPCFVIQFWTLHQSQLSGHHQHNNNIINIITDAIEPGRPEPFVLPQFGVLLASLSTSSDKPATGKQRLTTVISSQVRSCFSIVSKLFNFLPRAPEGAAQPKHQRAGVSPGWAPVRQWPVYCQVSLLWWPGGLLWRLWRDCLWRQSGEWYK